MLDQDLTEYSRSLAAWAKSLSGSAPELPIMLNGICRDLGVVVKGSDKIERYSAHLSDPRSGRAPTISIPMIRNIGPYTRFCIAHELAHLHLLEKYNARPTNNSEYWKLEAVCDEFARTLLLPDAAIDKNIAACDPDPLSFLHFCNSLAESANIVWMQAAIRITQKNSNIIFLRCAPRFDEVDLNRDHYIDRNEYNSFISKSIKYVVENSSAKNKIGRGSVIHRHTDFFRLINELDRNFLGRGESHTQVARDLLPDPLLKMTAEKSDIVALVDSAAVGVVRIAIYNG